jgi:hypothetical protein
MASSTTGSDRTLSDAASKPVAELTVDPVLAAR